jgi:hypothetical protein
MGPEIRETRDHIQKPLCLKHLDHVPGLWRVLTDGRRLWITVARAALGACFPGIRRETFPQDDDRPLDAGP